MTLVGSPTTISVPTGLQTPTLLIDPELVTQAYVEAQRWLPSFATVRFPARANPTPVVLRALANCGAGFEVATAAEAELLIAVGVAPERLVHSLRFRACGDVRESAALGVFRWAVDSEAEVRKLATHAPRSTVAIQLQRSSGLVGWEGTGVRATIELVSLAAELGLRPETLVVPTAHSERGLHGWLEGLQFIHRVLDQLDERLRPETISLGSYRRSALAPDTTPELAAAAVAATLDRVGYPIALEATADGDWLSDAGTLIAEVTGISVQEGQRWVYLDVEKFNWPDPVPHTSGPVVLGTHGDELMGSSSPGRLATLATGSTEAISPPVDLPDSLEPGSHVGIIGVGAVFSQQQTVLDVRAATSVADPQGERISLRDRDLYRAAWPGSRLFEECRELERLWFEMSGFVEADGLDGFHRYDAASTFLAVRGPDGDILSTMRLIWSSPLGFKTLNDLALSPEGAALVEEVPQREMAEVGTLATHPGARSMGPTFQIFFALNDMMARRGVTHFISAIDDGLLRIMRGEPTRFPMVDIGSSVHYYGAPSTPVIMNVPAYRRQLFAQNRPLYRELIEGQFSIVAD